MVYQNKLLILFLFLFLGGCFSYSFSGGNIPTDVNLIYIPYFQDKTNSGQSALSDQLYRSLIDRFVNQSRLQLASSESDADVVFSGFIANYKNSPFSISGEQISNENRVEITVKAVYKYKNESKPVYDKTFTGFANFETTTDPLTGEQTAIIEALDQITRKMFDDAVGQW